MQEMRVQSLGQEEPLEKKQSSIVAWKIPWTEEPGGLQSMGRQRVIHNLATKQQEIHVKCLGQHLVRGQHTTGMVCEYLIIHSSQQPHEGEGIVSNR